MTTHSKLAWPRMTSIIRLQWALKRFVIALCKKENNEIKNRAAATIFIRLFIDKKR